MHPATSWRLVVPVKLAEVAKSRLVPPVPVSRPDLARAMARDTLEAVCGALEPGAVLTVTSDPAAAAAARGLGAAVLADPGDGLNAAVRAGAAAWLSNGPGPVGILLGDLPALQPADLLAALAACGQHDRAVVPDAGGTGTVLLTALDGAGLRPRFGPASAARHAESATRLDLDLPRLRTDVDDAASLAAVAHLGVGRHTAAALARACLHGPAAPAQ